VTFETPPATPGLPSFQRDSRVGGLTPSLSHDSRENLFTPIHGTYAEAVVDFFSEALGGNDEFQRVNLTAMHFLRLHPKWTLGLRGDAKTNLAMRRSIYDPSKSWVGKVCDQSG
jgi:outer membrane protein assembly factor BamA